MTPPQNYSRGDDDVRDGNGKQKFPADVHELVITEAGKRAACPDVEKEEDENFCGKPEGGLDEFVDGVELRYPSSGEQNSADGEHGETDGRKNEFAEDGLVADAVVDDPEAEGN